MFVFALVPMLAGLLSVALQQPNTLPFKTRLDPKPVVKRQQVFSTRINERGQEVFIIKEAQAYRGQAAQGITISKGTP